MKPTHKRLSPRGRFLSSQRYHIEQIINSDSSNSLYENEIMLDDLDLFLNQKKSRRGHQTFSCGVTA